MISKKAFKDFLPYCLPVCFLIAAIKLVAYYAYFDIDISEYISISEVFTTFLNDGVSVLGIVALAMALSILSFDFVSTKIRDAVWDMPINMSNTKGRIGFFLRVLWPMYALIFGLLFLSLFFSGAIFRHVMIVTTLLTIAVFIIAIAGFEIVYLIYKDKKPEELEKSPPDISFMPLAVFIASVASLVFWNTDAKILSIKAGKYNGSTFIYTDKSIVSSDTMLYIGRTEKYLYFYNKLDRDPIIVSSEDLKRIKIVDMD